VLATDNTTVVAYLQNQGGTRCHALFLLCKEILLLCLLSHIHLVVRHIPGTFNVLADCVSLPQSSQHRMGTTASSVRLSCSAVGSSSCRSLCYQSESQTGNLCTSSSRPSVLRSRRHVVLKCCNANRTALISSKLMCSCC
jgi:hypothetical protein